MHSIKLDITVIVTAASLEKLKKKKLFDCACFSRIRKIFTQILNPKIQGKE